MEREQEFDLWNTQKKILHDKISSMYFREGDIRWCSLGMNIRTEAYGKGTSFRRPILILKKLSNESCIGIPLSSKSKQGSWFCKYIMHGVRGTALIYQIRMFHKNRFQRKIGEMDESDFGLIKKRLKRLLNL